MLPLLYVLLGLRDLMDKRRADLLQSKAGAYYESMLDEQLPS
jgi:Rod binding domain-containing protein